MSDLRFSAVQFVTACTDWQSAVQLACRPLEVLKVISPDYARAIIDTTEKTGPWYILTAGFAMPHARPEAGVLSQQTHLSLLRISEGVLFGEGENVGLVIVLAAGNGADHLGKIQQLTLWLEDKQRLEKLLQTRSKQALEENIR